MIKEKNKVFPGYLAALIKTTGGINGPIGRQFIASSKKAVIPDGKYLDPLEEDKFKVAPGVIYKYRGRCLWVICRNCSAYCRFCTRGREVGPSQKPFLEDGEIEKGFEFIAKNKEINEVILSGGDPLTAPRSYLEKIIKRLANLQKKGQLSIVRVGTRAPIINPRIINDWHLKLVAELRNPYLMVHINHPLELTNEAVAVLNKFRKECLATIMSQTVFLSGINDSAAVLLELFNKLAANGVRPYYLLQNDPVYWARRFTVPIKKGIKIWQQIRPKLSGVAATAKYVIDCPFGVGKIVVPEGNSWKVDYSKFKDFDGSEHQIEVVDRLSE